MADNQTSKVKWYQNRFLILAAIILTFIAISWFGSSVAPVTINGTMTLSDSGFGSKGESCQGSGGYSDIKDGAQVTVSNSDSGSVAAVSSLGTGKVDDSGNCEFSFKIDNVPNSSVYQIEVSHRGKLIYSKKQMEDKGYKVEMTLGN